MEDHTNSFIHQEELTWELVGDQVRRQIMGWNEQMMMVKVEFLKTGAIGAVHTHPHIQDSYVASGKFEVTIGDMCILLQTGDGFFVESGLSHGVLCMEPGVLIDVFSPYRADFLPERESF